MNINTEYLQLLAKNTEIDWSAFLTQDDIGNMVVELLAYRLLLGESLDIHELERDAAYLTCEDSSVS